MATRGVPGERDTDAIALAYRITYILAHTCNNGGGADKSAFSSTYCSWG